jgi:Transposase DDE domain
MAERRRVVFREQSSSDRLPDWASTGVVLIEWLRQRGLWQEITDRLKIQREGGYTGIDAFVFLVYFFSSNLKLGVKEFSERARKQSLRLAAVGGRLRMPTQASMSRLLASVEVIATSGFGAWLLNEVPGVAAVLQHPSVLTRDAMGEGWHVFDWDPTVTTLRHRALPVFEGMPVARRRSEALAKPGYSGRKRGDVQFSRATLQHAGSGLWLGIELGPGNGAQREAIHRAIEQIGATCQHANLPLERSILRADGAAGNVPFITACTQAGIHYLTRLANYKRLQDPAVVRHLNEAKWFEVPSSGSGPTRQATDLGQLTLPGTPTTLQADGSAFAPVDARVVVSRFRVPEGDEGRGAGVVIQGWQYELFGTNLPATSWPEIEIVAGYYGRSGQENRFYQEDREFGLDRIFSYHLPGQMLATWIGLFVWNFNICRGMDIAQPPTELPEQPVQSSMLVTQMPCLPDVGLSESAVVSDNTSAADPTCASVAPTDSTVQPAEIASEAGSTRLPRARRVSDQHTMREVFNTLDWKQLLDKHDGWSWSAADGALRCPAKARLPLVRVEQVKGHPIRARFQADGGICGECARRSVCIESNDPYYRKDVRFGIPSPQAEILRELSLRGAHPTHASRPLRAARVTSQEDTTEPMLWQPPELPPQRAALAMAPPCLLPAALRKLSRRVTDSTEVHVAVVLPSLRPRPCPVLACSVAVRQQRRLTWSERLRWNQLPKDCSVEIQMFGSKLVEQLLATAADSATTLAQTA